MLGPGAETGRSWRAPGAEWRRHVWGATRGRRRPAQHAGATSGATNSPAGPVFNFGAGADGRRSERANRTRADYAARARQPGA